MDPNQNKSPKKPDGKKPKLNIWFALLAAIAIVLVISVVFNAVRNSQYHQTTFSEFMEQAEAGNIAEVELHQDRVIYMTKEEAAKPARQQRACFTGMPYGDILGLARELNDMGISVDEHIVEDNSTIMMILSYAIMIGGLFSL